MSGIFSHLSPEEADMQVRSLPRRKVVVGCLMASAMALLGCGPSPFSPDQAAAKAVALPVLRRRLTVKQVVNISSDRPISPLEALRKSGLNFQTARMNEGLFVISINSTIDVPWIFLVDGVMPDLSGAGQITRLGKVEIISRAEAQQYLATRFRGGTMGLALSTQVDDSIRPPTVETVFSPASGQRTTLISWLQVGLLQPDMA